MSTPPNPSDQAYMYNEDDFNWNHGLSLASTGNYKVRIADVGFRIYREQMLLPPR